MLLSLLVLALAPQLRVAGPPLRSSRSHTSSVCAAGAVDNDDALTLAQLRLQLRAEWHALCELAEEEGSTATRSGCSVGEWASRNMLATRLEALSLNRCYVAESTLAAAGNGLFASRDISAGELITLYPGDGVCIEDGATAAGSSLWAASAADGLRRSLDASILERGKDYEREVDREVGTTSVLGDPLLVEDPAYLGHMLNDGATCTREALRTAYVAEAAAACNVHQVALDACHVAIVATRDVWKDEELFMAYGAGYWTSRLGAKQVEYTGRLLEDYWVEDDAGEEYARHRRRRGKSSRRRP